MLSRSKNEIRLAAVGVFALGAILSTGRAPRADDQLGAAAAATDHEGDGRLASHRREPIAIIDGERGVYVVNRLSGTLSLLDRQTGEVLAEHTAAKRIAHAVAIANGSQLLLIDELDREVQRVDLTGVHPVVRRLAKLPNVPARIEVNDPRREVYVTAFWERRIWSFVFDPGYTKVAAKRTIELPFVPRDMVVAKGGAVLVVASAFGDQIAFVSTRRSRIDSVKSIGGHNIRGLGMDAEGRRLHVAQQRLAKNRRADYEELHWGRLVANGVQLFDLDELMSGGAKARGWLDQYGGIGGATGDPAGVVTAGKGVSAVAFGGVGEVAVRFRGYAKRIPVGARPEAMMISGERLYVANRFDDTVSIIDLPKGKVANTVKLGPAPPLTAIERGRRLFFDARLSHDGWISCHSCHADGHSSDLLVDTLSDGDYGAPKRVPSLLAVANSAPFGWTASSETLGEQIQKSITTTMHGARLTDRQVADMLAFLGELETPTAPSNSPQLV
ncbi:MAG: cytochrome c peroxidase, partial [Pirellulaceae bacterium]|nr:cytochrome c peroxidase [Pirellulaceae bacterium]